MNKVLILTNFFSRLLSILLFSVTSMFAIYGQAQKIVPVSPEAASLAKIVNYGVNLNTGVPEIGLPLYQIETGGMSLPIALQYHAGGFQINERSTSIGLGFSLSCDLQIVRTINGLDDLDPFTGYLVNSKIKAHKMETNLDDFPFHTPGAYYVGQNTKDIAEGNMDGMPDKFNYRLLNKAGSFYFQKNDAGNGYTIVPVPYDNLQISYSKANNSFTITDTDGTVYSFGGTGFLEQITEGAGPYPYTSWKCKIIDNPTKTESISFAYIPKSPLKSSFRPERIEFSNELGICGRQIPYYTSDVIMQRNPEIVTYENLVAIYPPNTLSSPQYVEYFGSGRSALFHLPYVGALNKSVDVSYRIDYAFFNTSTTSALALSGIVFRGGSVAFSGTDELFSITIKDASAAPIKEFKFKQSYTLPYNLATARVLNGANFQGTLYLDSIMVKSNDVLSERYIFQYDKKFCFGSHVSGKDAWGYSNDYTIDGTSYYNPNEIPSTIPHQQIKQQVILTPDPFSGCATANDVTFDIGNSENTELPSAKASTGVLNRIIYPTGGYVDFNFEGNKYNVLTSGYVIKTGGGLRVKSINYYDGKSELPVSQKYYRYGETEDGVGILMRAPDKRYNYETNEYDAYSYGYLSAYNPGVQGTFSVQTVTYAPASSLNYTYPHGAPIYYTRVTEYNSDFGVNTGKKVYTFFPPGAFCIVDSRTKVAETNIDVLHSDGLMGKQQSLKEYKFENGRYALIHSKEFEYIKSSRPQQVKVVYAYTKLGISFAGTVDGQLQKEIRNNKYWETYNSGEYGIEVARLLLTAEKEKWVNNTDTLSQQITYTYDAYLQPSSIASYNSKGQQIIRSIKYPYSFTESIYPSMLSKNMISMPIEETVTRGSFEISRSKTNYGSITIPSGPTFIVPVSMQKSAQGTALETQMTFDSYDKFANIQQITGRDGIQASYVWGYNRKYLLAEIKGASFASVSSAINVESLQSITDETQLRASINTVKMSLPQTLVSTFTHKPLIGLSSQTSPSDQVSYYNYDAVGRLSLIKDQNADIVKKYDYSMLNNATQFGNNNYYYANAPVLETFYKLFDNQKVQPYNYIIPGGAYVGYLPSIPNNAVINELEAIRPPNYSEGPYCGTPKDVAKLVLKNRGIQSAHFDMLQGGSIVASGSFPVAGTRPEDLTAYKEFYVPAGEYQISLRLEGINYQGRVRLNLVDDATLDLSLSPGDKVNLIKNKTYTVLVYKEGQ